MSRPFLAVLARLHLLVGLFIGPFLFVVALSGVLYALTPQLENQLYAGVLHTRSQGPALPLEEQVRAAQAALGQPLEVAAVRPAAQPGDTTRVMFSGGAGFGGESNRALFVDPVTGKVLGDLAAYGTSGVLPLRTWLDQFHRSLLLGEWGRMYSELAASWLWIAAIGGLAMWFVRRRAQRGPRLTTRRLHSQVGLWLMLGFLFFSATGLTWSRFAGDNIGVLRAQFGMGTPSVDARLGMARQMPMQMDAHAEHHMHMAKAEPVVLDAALFDRVLASARLAGIDAAKLEIRPSRSSDKAWTVTEIDRGWPTQVDAVAIDPHDLSIVDQIRFADFPMAAKLTRWGIDAHMGSLFGLANQLILVAVASGLLLMVILGYRLWWRRRAVIREQGPTLVEAWRMLGAGGRVALVVMAVVFGLALPVMGASLLAMLAWDAWVTARRPKAALAAA